MRTLATIQQLDRSLIGHFPQFAGSLREHDKMVRWTTRRTKDELYHFFCIQIGSCNEATVALNWTIGIHYFEECPLPPGVFGTAANVMDIIDGVPLKQASKYLSGLNWLCFDTENFADEFSAFLAVARCNIESSTEAFAHELASDSFRRNSHKHAMSLEKPAEFRSILEALEKFGKPRIIGGLDYGAAKAARQIEFWSNGQKHWAQV